MKHVIVASIVACAAMSASAQSSYTEAVELQQRCRTQGEMWREVKASSTIGGKPLKFYSREKDAGRLDKESFMQIYMTFLSAESSLLRTPEDAYMKGWAACMDKK